MSALKQLFIGKPVGELGLLDKRFKIRKNIIRIKYYEKLITKTSK